MKLSLRNEMLNLPTDGEIGRTLLWLDEPGDSKFYLGALVHALEDGGWNALSTVVRRLLTILRETNSDDPGPVQIFTDQSWVWVLGYSGKQDGSASVDRELFTALQALDWHRLPVPGNYTLSYDSRSHGFVAAAVAATECVEDWNMRRFDITPQMRQLLDALGNYQDPCSWKNYYLVRSLVKLCDLVNVLADAMEDAGLMRWARNRFGGVDLDVLGIYSVPQDEVEKPLDWAPWYLEKQPDALWMGRAILLRASQENP